MTIPQWAQRHYRSILFALAAFAASGIFAGLGMPISLFPRMSFPRVFVNIDAGDRPVERMAVEITWPVEEAVRSVPGVRNVRSNTSRGSANVSVNFDWNVDMISAMLQVESAINQTRGSLPTGTNFLVIIPFFALGYFAYQHTGSGFLPSMDEGGFILDYRTKSGTSLSETDRLMRQVEEILQATPEVQTYSRRTGRSLGGFITEANEGDFFVRLIPMPRCGLDDVMDEIRDRIVHEIPGIEIEMVKLMEDIIGDLTAVPQPIEIKLFSDNGELLQRLAEKSAQAIKNIPGVVDVRDGIVLAGDAMEIHVDRVKAALEGMTPGEVTQTLENSLRGKVATNIQSGPKVVGLRVWIPREERFSTENVRNMRLQSSDGHLFPLKRIANIEPVAGQSQIARDNLKRMIAVTGRIRGRDMGFTVHDVIRVLDQPGFLPKDVYYTIGGLYEQQQDAFRDLLTVFAAAVLLIFVLLLFLFESFQAAIAMMLTTLLSLVAVFIGLWLTRTDLTITAMMGMTMIVGIVTEVAIFFYSEYRDLPHGVALAQRLTWQARTE